MNHNGSEKWSLVGTSAIEAVTFQTYYRRVADILSSDQCEPLAPYNMNAYVHQPEREPDHPAWFGVPDNLCKTPKVK